MNTERLAQLDSITLSKGMHKSIESGACAMELVSWLADEPWSDRPACCSPIIGDFIRAWNDQLDNADRNRLLKPVLHRLIDTANTDDECRAWIITDWALRDYTPIWLELVPSLFSQAEALRGCPPITDRQSLAVARRALDAARMRAEAVRIDSATASEAMKAAAWAAAWAAMKAAGWAVAWAVGSDDASDATCAATREAARCTSRALRPTVETLQESALRLLDRMIAVTPGEQR